MPLPSPHKGQSRKDFLEVCFADPHVRKESDNDNNRVAGLCYSLWNDHKTKASYVIATHDDEFATFADSIDAPVSSTPSYDQSINPDNPKMPPSVKTVSPKDSQPKGPEDAPDDSEKVKKSEDDGDSPDLYDEVDVQASQDSKFRVPENWDLIKDLSTKDFTVWAGANDWENSWSAVAFQFYGNTINRYTKRVWGHIVVSSESQDGRGKWNDFGKGVVNAWIEAAKSKRDSREFKSYYPADFSETASSIQNLASHGIERVNWISTEAVEKPIRDEEIDDRIKDASSKNPKSPNPEKGGPASAPNPDMSGNGPIDSQDMGPPVKIESMPWFMGGLEAETDEEGLAKWPLSFKKIEKDFKRPNKPGNPDQEPKAQDSQKPATEEEPYVM